MTPYQLGQLLQQRFPAYKDKNPLVLGQRLVDKYPEYNEIKPIGGGGIPQKTTLIVVRHGSTKLNSEDKLRGWMNVPLDAQGKKEAQEVGKRLKDKGIQKIYTSDLSRASDTAEAISKHSKAPVVEKTKSLRPWDTGELSGKPVKDTLPIMQDYARNKPDERLPGGESFNNFKDRFLSYVQGLIQKNPGKTIAIVAHHRNDRVLAGWEKAGMKPDLSVDVDTMLQKGIEPGANREIVVHS